MKIIAINGSPRKNNNSAKMLQSAVNGAVSAGATVETVNLFDLKFVGCRSCFACKLLGGNSFAKCALKDDLSPVLDKILKADTVIQNLPSERSKNRPDTPKIRAKYFKSTTVKFSRYSYRYVCRRGM